MSRRARHAATRMGAGAAHVERPQRAAVVAMAEDRTGAVKLVQRQSAMEDVPANQSETLFEIGRRQHHPAEDAGAGFVGDAGFGSGVFYLYACVDCDLLEENLAGDTALAREAAAALVEALATTSPAGKQNSYAHRPRAGHIRAEFGRQQPRSLDGAFFKAVEGTDLMPASVNAMNEMADRMEQAYGDAFEDHEVMDIGTNTGSLAEIIAFIDRNLTDA